MGNTDEPNDVVLSAQLVMLILNSSVFGLVAFERRQ